MPFVADTRKSVVKARPMILDGTLTPLTLERKTPEGFLCGHDADMGGFEPRPWRQSGAELEVYFDRNETESFEKEHPVWGVRQSEKWRGASIG